MYLCFNSKSQVRYFISFFTYVFFKMHIYIYIYTYAYRHIFLCVCVCMYTCMYVCVYLCGTSDETQGIKTWLVSTLPLSLICNPIYCFRSLSTKEITMGKNELGMLDGMCPPVGALWHRHWWLPSALPIEWHFSRCPSQPSEVRIGSWTGAKWEMAAAVLCTYGVVIGWVLLDV